MVTIRKSHRSIMPDSKLTPRQILGWGIFFVAATGAGYALGSLAQRSPHLLAPLRPLLDLPALAFFAALPLTAFLVILVHELGHVIAGVLTGMTFKLLIVGPLHVERTGSRLRFKWNRQLALWGGIAVCLPTSPERLDRQMATMVLGGPIASLLLALLAALLFPLWPPWLLVAILSAGITLVTGFPAHTGPFYTDGARVRMLWRGGPDAERWISVTLSYSYTANGLRPRNWPSELVSRLERHASSSLDGLGCALQAYSAALDRQDLSSAAHWLDLLLSYQDHWPSHLKAPLMLEAAYFTARHQHRAAPARAFLDQSAAGLLIEPATRLRSEAAVLFAEGHAGTALATVQRAIEAAQSSASPTAQLETEWLTADLHYYSQSPPPPVAS